MALGLFDMNDVVSSDRLSGFITRTLNEIQLSELNALHTTLKVMKEEEVTDQAERQFLLSVCRVPARVRIQQKLALTAKSTERLGVNGSGSVAVGIGSFTAGASYLSQTELEQVGASEVDLEISTAGSEDFKVTSILERPETDGIDRLMTIIEKLLDAQAIKEEETP